MASAGSAGMGTITKMVIGVTTTLVVVFGGLIGLVFARNAMPSAQESGDRVRAAAVVETPVRQDPSASPVSAPPQLRTTAALAPTSAAPQSEQVQLEAEPAVAAASRPISTKNLFVGAVAAPGASARPSVGGIRLATSGRGALAGKVVVVDPGHNGVADAAINNRQVPDGTGRRKACNTTGTSTRGGYTEHAHNWAVATRLAAVLKSRGATVVLTRPSDRGVGPCVDQRAAIGNVARANLVLSIHADGAASASRGFHVIRSTRMAGGTDITAASARAAAIVRDAYAKVTGRPRSTYLGGGTGITPRGDIAGMNLSRVPSIMVEAGNMRNAAEARLLASSAFQDKEAYALAAAAQTVLRR